MSTIFLRWGLPAFVTVVAGTFLAVTTTGAAIPQDLEARSATALSGHQWAAVEFDARDAVLTGTASDQRAIDDAVVKLAAVHGVRSVLAKATVEGHEGGNSVDIQEHIAESSETGSTPPSVPADGVKTPTGADPDVAPPQISEYRFAASLHGGSIILEGFVPDAPTRERLGELRSVDASRLELGTGEPARFQSGVDFVLAALGHMSEGSASIEGTVISIEGRAATPAEFEELETLVGLGAPQGVILKAASIKPPIAKPYGFAAEKGADGTYSLSGYVPDDYARKAFSAALTGAPADTLTLADGNPADFQSQALKAIAILPLLDSGRVAFDGETWSFTGTAGSSEGAAAVEKAFAEAGLDTAAWTYDVKAAAPAERDVVPKVADAAPPVDPYVWSAVKAPDGAFTLSGHVPTDQLRRFIVVRAGKVDEDTTVTGSGAPDGFIPQVLAGLDALQKLESGRIEFDGQRWSISGLPATAADLEAAKAALAAAPDGGTGWAQDLSDPPAEAVAETAPPAPTPEPEPAPTVPVVRNYVFKAKKLLGHAIAFEGAIPAEPMRRHLAVISSTEANDALVVGAGLPDDFIQRADTATRALVLLADGEFGLDGDQWVFAGRAETEAGREAALAALAAVPGLTWQADVTLLSPLELCNEKVGAFARRNAILFQSGSARIADGSLPAIDELAGYLSLCPEATVNVEGHTDSDGDAQANLALSVSRAESVVDALVARGISPARLYAIGYGESLPIADNETRDGKQANRRIAFTLSDE